MSETHKIDCALPLTVCIKESKLNGVGLFVTRNISADEFIYENTFQAVYLKDFSKKIELHVNGSKYLIETCNHSTPYINGLHAIYNFDSLMNHHCEASTHDKVDALNPLKYYVYATRDLLKGEELTCNYNTYKYVNMYPFDCLCNSIHCCKRVEGFSKLNEEQKKRLLKWTDTSAQMWKQKERADNAYLFPNGI